MGFEFLYLLLFFLLIFWIRGFTVLLHELGHALMAIYLSKEKVTVYVGSFGERKDTRHLKLGLLECYFKKSMAWDRGLCVPESKNFTLNGQILYTVMGPVVTILCAVVFGILAYSIFIPNWIRVFSGLMSFISLTDALRALIPSKRPILMANDGITYNDGQILRNLLNHKRLNSKFKEVEIATNQKDYERAGDLLMEAMPKAKNKSDLYRYAASVYSEGKYYEKAIDCYTAFEQEGGMDSNDYNHAGLIFAYLLQYENALSYFKKAVKLQRDNNLALTNIAFSHLMLEQYSMAFELFDELFQKDPENAYLLANRGLAAFKTGQITAGLDDLERAKRIDPEESYVYRNLGMALLDQGDPIQAHENFIKAQALNPQTHLIDSLLEKAEAA
ncbi:MAG: hypothetical protein NW218_14370 [Saprospiraceae bacterium]|nr:hypothetical protein [Saprospiraceae bacterium]